MSKLALNINSRSISIGETARVFTELIKLRITFLVTLTTAMGYILASGDFISLEGLIFVSSGIFLLASAASCLNHWQESKTDALMERTRYRPIPSGRIDPNSVLLVFVILFISGSLVLLFKSGFYSFLAGVFTFIWYNFIYTPLKRKTAFAIIPGALVGALPPLVGWLAAGGNVSDSIILATAMYFFIWQIPHFWLLLMIYGDDYEKAGFPTLRSIFTDEQLRRITFMWLVANTIIALSLLMFIRLNYELSFYLFLLSVFWMIYVSVNFFRLDLTNHEIRKTFISLNFFTLILVTIISLDKLIGLL